MIESSRTIRSAGQTEAGSAGTQPARDNRPGLRQQVESGIHRPQNRWIPSPSVRTPVGALAICWRSSPMPQKIHLWNTNNRPAVGRISILAELGPRPIQAEPVQMPLQGSPAVKHPGRRSGSEPSSRSPESQTATTRAAGPNSEITCRQALHGALGRRVGV